MALLQVHLAKAFKQLHEGDADPGVLQELRTSTDESHSACPGSDNVHISGPGALPMVDLGGYEGVRQASLPGLPDLPGRPIRRSGGGLCPTVLCCTEADGGISSHPAPAVRCSLHPTTSCSPSICSSQPFWQSAPPPLKLGHSKQPSQQPQPGAGRRKAAQPVLVLPRAWQGQRQAAFLRRATRSLWILLFRRW